MISPQLSRVTRPRRIVPSQILSPRQIRNFHPTRPSPFVNELLSVSSGFIHGVHAVTGLPWVASIPLTAFIVRMVVAFPLQIYSRVHARREADITPLLRSHRTYLQNLIMKQQVDREQQLLPGELTMVLNSQIKKKQKGLQKRWRVNRYARFVPFLQVPVWLTLMESIRAMCGNTKGLLPYLFPQLVADPADAGTIGAQLAAEPTFAMEGALWFPDLLAGDPTGVLPLFLTASILTNVLSGWKTHRLTDLWDLPRVELIPALALKTLKSIVVLLAMNIGVSAYTTGMPAGLLIYWIASTTTASLQTLFLDKFMFSAKPLKSWRKMHIGVRRPGEVKKE